MKVKSDGGSSSYYQLPEHAKEIQDIIEDRNMNFAVGNIFKACYRLGEKDGTSDLYDINKILWFANREKARLEMERDNKIAKEELKKLMNEPPSLSTNYTMDNTTGNPQFEPQPTTGNPNKTQPFYTSSLDLR